MIKKSTAVTPDVKPPHVDDRLIMGTGLLLLVLCVVLAIVFDTPSPFQFRIFSGVFALGAGAFAHGLSGMIVAQLSFGQRLAISATGAMAIFVLTFFFEPAGSASSAGSERLDPGALDKVRERPETVDDVGTQEQQVREIYVRTYTPNWSENAPFSTGMSPEAQNDRRELQYKVMNQCGSCVTIGDATSDSSGAAMDVNGPDDYIEFDASACASGGIMFGMEVLWFTDPPVGAAVGAPKMMARAFDTVSVYAGEKVRVALNQTSNFNAGPMMCLNSKS